jgi:D-arabinose 1-dehydrogenase-like Zn-dependent alcohol dehydrogenase
MVLEVMSFRRHPRSSRYADLIHDGATLKRLQAGGVIVSYGMTLGPSMPFLMGAVLKNIEVKGSTMGSRKEFGDMLKFVREKNLRPVVSDVVKGLDIAAIDGLFDIMKKGSQFGKLVIDLQGSGSTSKL